MVHRERETLIPQIQRGTEKLGSDGVQSHYNPGHTLRTLVIHAKFLPDPASIPSTNIGLVYNFMLF